MSDVRTEPASIRDRTRRIATDAPVTGIHFLGQTAVFVLGEEAIMLVDADGERRVAVHAGAILACAGDGRRVVTGGDDGRVVSVDATGRVETLASDGTRRWIDRVALGPDAAVAWSAGKQAFVRAGEAKTRVLETPSSPGGLAFAPKGLRLAVTHYNGVSLWFANSSAAAEVLEWKGSHLLATFSRDGKFLITAMQEPTLHGWRLADRRDMRMSGYSAKVQSMGWTADGRWLATSGSEQLILWPFQAKDGPMGKPPRILAPYRCRVTRVACHPAEAIISAGFEDGLVLVVRIDDGAEIVTRRPGDVAISALAWNASGTALGFGTEEGEAGLVEL